jgi:hypothetical protein
VHIHAIVRSHEPTVRTELYGPAKFRQIREAYRSCPALAGLAKVRLKADTTEIFHRSQFFPPACSCSNASICALKAAYGCAPVILRSVFTLLLPESVAARKKPGVPVTPAL